MLERAIQGILDNMRDSDDPIEGAVFEKTVETSFEDFCAFMLSAYSPVTMERQMENGNTLYLFYNGDRAADHIGTYIPFKNTGCFGGLRVGSKNPWLKPGDPLLKDPLCFENLE